MNGYYAIVEKDADSAFGVRFPDVEGCFSASDEENRVLPNAIEALSLHLKGMAAYPPPRALEAITGDPDIRSALRNGGYLVYVPRIVSQNRPVRVDLSFGDSLAALT